MNSPSLESLAVSDTIPDHSAPITHAATVIRPLSGWAGLNIPQLWQHRELCITFALRDIKLRYRQTALGVMWVFLLPLITAVLFSFIFNEVAKLPTENIPPLLFTFVGMMSWNVFSATLSKASGSILSHSGLVSKVFFPRLLLPFSTAFSSLIDLGVAFGALIVLLLVYGVMPSIGIVFLPVWIFFLILLALGIGTLASALVVFYRDIGYVIPVVINLLLYATPIAYSLNGVLNLVNPRLQIVFYLNPLVGLLEATRWSVFGTTSIHWNLVGYSIIASIAIFLLGILFFRRLEGRFADVI